LSTSPTYILDANVFIEAARRYYAFDLVPGFWQSLEANAKSGKISSIDRIKTELERGQDDLAEWATHDFDHAFQSTDSDDIVSSYRDIMNWVSTQSQFSESAKAQFANSADGWLIAIARVKGYTLVTHEQLAPSESAKVKIPNVCQAFDVPYVDTFEMLRSLGVRFN